MKNFLMIGLLALSGFSAHADSGAIECKNKSGDGSIRISIDEMSEISKEGTALFLSDKIAKLTGFKATQTKYGLTGLDVKIGSGNKAVSYSFKNLGANECFAVYGSSAKGKAYVEVTANEQTSRYLCECDQD